MASSPLTGGAVQAERVTALHPDRRPADARAEQHADLGMAAAQRADRHHHHEDDGDAQVGHEGGVATLVGQRPRGDGAG
jgi:hypothetical protein